MPKELKMEDMPTIVLPLLEDEDGKADQTENVTINGKTWIIKRGEYDAQGNHASCDAQHEQ